MSFAEMTKEQKQYIFLGIIVGGIVMFSLVNFVLTPMKESWSSAKSDVMDLESKLDDARRLVKGRDKLEANLAKLDEDMERAVQEYLPDSSNPLAWATRNIYSVAREVGLDIRSVSELAPSPVLQALGGGETRQFGSYTVQIESECEYDVLRTFLESLGGSNPYLCISSIQITGERASPEVHRVQVTVDWPAWIDASAAKNHFMPQGDDRG